MRRELSRLDGYLDAVGADGYLIDAAGETADQQYLTELWTSDPFVSLYTDGSLHCLVSPLEFNRARTEARAASVSNLVAFDFFERLDTLERHEAWVETVVDFCATHDVASVAVPERFPYATGAGLRDHGMAVTADTEGVIEQIRAIKSEPEVEAIAAAQAAAGAGMETAHRLLTDAGIGEGGVLVLDGEVLTSERLKTAIERTLLDRRCGLDDTIVACGRAAADPHNRGSGPLEANETIVIDIFPRHKGTGYHGDLTRTFVKGTPSDRQRTWYDDTVAAQEAALDVLRAGIDGETVHDAVSTTYEQRGYPTLRSDSTTEVGFIHATGHGVGLEVHEAPSLSKTGEELLANHVVAVEPGLYDPEVGGVRIEDLVVVTEDGHHNLTAYPKRLRIE